MTKIEVCNVVKTIRNNTVIDDITVSFDSGKIYGLKGINGSGKTMLMRLICGLIRPTKGSILINGKMLWRDITFPESIGILLENPAFLDFYSGRENLHMLAAIKKTTDDRRIRQVLDMVGLNPEDKKKYKKYSLGMKQRLGIAAAIMESPDIVLLDEPTNALDSDGIERFKKILEKERERGALIILTCHDYETLRELCDEIYMIEGGKLAGHIES
ncbi:ABC transporter ATP-binding protein [Murimonas intestini]|uniref:ABC transporter ATP-binding protein n=1 Tax=Murimonas intestini TaxID=1337051 RepID=UPI0011DD4D32|nr:ABC transporter ATP-binding protein [Murimonas intestini]